MKYKIYVGALDGAKLSEESEDKTKLVQLYETFAATHDVVTATLTDENFTNLNSELVHRADLNTHINWD